LLTGQPGPRFGYSLFIVSVEGLDSFSLELGLHYQDKDFKGCRRGISEFDFKGCWKEFLNFCLFLQTASSTIRIPRKKWSGCRRFYFP